MQSLIQSHALLADPGTRLAAVALAACLVNRARLPGMLLAAKVAARHQPRPGASQGREGER